MLQKISTGKLSKKKLKRQLSANILPGGLARTHVHTKLVLRVVDLIKTTTKKLDRVATLVTDPLPVLTPPAGRILLFGTPQLYIAITFRPIMRL